MNFEEIREYCLSKPGVTEEFPFGPQTLVMKVGGKMFLLTDVENPLTINLKCDPELALELREKYDSVLPGYHQNKKHWNTVSLKGKYHKAELLSWIDLSYTLVLKGLPAAEKEKLTKKI